MANRMSKGIDTGSLPSAQYIIALSARPDAAGGVNAVSSGLTSGFNLAQTLADRQAERQKKLAELQLTIQKAKEEAMQKQKEQQLASTVAQTTPEATRPVSTITFGGGQIPMAKNTQSFEAEQPARVDQAMLAAYPKETTQTNYANEKERLKSDRDAKEAVNLQNLKFSQAKELLGMKQANAKEKGGKIPVSLINDENLITNQQNMLNSIEKTLSDAKATGLKGAVKSMASKVTLGNIAPEIRLYDQNRPATAVSLYRALTGDTRLSDSDAKARALPLLPLPGEPASVHKAKIAFLRNGLSQRQATIKKVSEMAKNNNLTSEEIEKMIVTPIPEEHSGEVDPSQFIEE